MGCPGASTKLATAVQAYLRDALGADAQIRSWSDARKLSCFRQDAFYLNTLRCLDREFLLVSSRQGQMPGLSAVFIAALLRKEWQVEWQPAEVTTALGYTAMTLSRAVRESPLAGLSALAFYSMLTEPLRPIYAVGAAQWKAIQQAGVMTLPESRLMLRCGKYGVTHPSF